MVLIKSRLSLAIPAIESLIEEKRMELLTVSADKPNDQGFLTTRDETAVFPLDSEPLQWVSRCVADET